MLQEQHLLENISRICAHKNHAQLLPFYSFDLSIILLLVAGIFLLKAVVQSHPKERRKSLKYSSLIFLLALLCLFHQWLWILPGLALYKLLPIVAKLIGKNFSQPDATSQQMYAPHQLDDSQRTRKAEEEGNASLHYHYLSSYYSYDEQPQALYPQALPPR